MSRFAFSKQEESRLLYSTHRWCLRYANLIVAGHSNWYETSRAMVEKLRRRNAALKRRGVCEREREGIMSHRILIELALLLSD